MKGLFGFSSADRRATRPVTESHDLAFLGLLKYDLISGRRRGNDNAGSQYLLLMTVKERKKMIKERARLGLLYTLGT